MAYVNFTLNEIWNFQNSSSDVASQIQNEVQSYRSAVEAAITKYKNAIDMYNESYTNLEVDYRNLGFVIDDNKKAIEVLKRRRDAAKDAMDRAPDDSKAAAKSRYHTAQDNLESAIEWNEDLGHMRDDYWQRMQETLQSIRVCEDAISTLNNNACEMEKMGNQYVSLVYQIQDAAKSAHDYGDRIIEYLKEDGVSSYHHDIRVRFHDHTALIGISESLYKMGARLDEKNNMIAEANYDLERSMTDKITRAAIAKMQEIEEGASGAGGIFKKMSKKSRDAYNCVIDYLNLKMTFR